MVTGHNGGMLMSTPNGKGGGGDGSYLADSNVTHYDGSREYSRNQTSTPGLLRQGSGDVADGSLLSDGRTSSASMQ